MSLKHKLTVLALVFIPPSAALVLMTTIGWLHFEWSWSGMGLFLGIYTAWIAALSGLAEVTGFFREKDSPKASHVPGSTFQETIARDGSTIHETIQAGHDVIEGDQVIGPKIVYEAATPIISTRFNLPSDVSDFTGREAEIAEVRHRLCQDGTVAISSIAGMGGIGKTVLALHVAHGLAAEGHFPDAQLYIDLKGTAPRALRSEEALISLLTALMGPDPRRPEDVDALARLWRGAVCSKRALLLLDNAANVAQVRPLLPGYSTSAVLITSRRRFKLPGSSLIDLDCLPPTEARELLQKLAPHVADAEADEIARLCGGLPLALRIAGNYLVLNDDCLPAEYIARLDDERQRLMLLRNPDAPDLDVAATLALSVAQLDAATRRAWALLALFPAPFDVVAAAALWGKGMGAGKWTPLDREAAQEQLRALRQRCLVTYDPENNRYGQHDLLRLAAAQALEELLKKKEITAARERLARHYLALAREQVPHLRGPDHLEAMALLDATRPNIHAAWDGAVEMENWELVCDLAYALAGYFQRRGLWADWIAWTETALKVCERAGDAAVRARLYDSLGSAYVDLPTGARTENLQQAIACFQQALRVYTPEVTPLDYASVQKNLGNAYRYLQTGDHTANLQQAITCYQEALRFWTPETAPFDYAMAQNNLGNVYIQLTTGDCTANLQQAIACFQEALRFWTPETAPFQYAGAQNNLGEAYRMLGTGNKADNLQKAIACFQEALRFWTPEIVPLYYAGIQNNLGLAHAFFPTGDHTANLQQAIAHYQEALRFWTPETAHFNYAKVQNCLGLAYFHLPAGDRTENLQQAIIHYQEALRFRTPETAPLDYARVQNNLGNVYLRLPAGNRAANLERAFKCYQEALHIYTPETAPSEYAWAQGSLGRAYATLASGDRTANLQKAIECYCEALCFWTPETDPSGYAMIQHSLGKAYLYLPIEDMSANLKQALEHTETALQVKGLSLWEQASCLFTRGLIHLAQNKPGQALADYQTALPLADAITATDALEDLKEFAANYPETPGLGAVRALFSGSS